ncbi:hypothetical protein F5Y09DRAFT_203362 [Xylaria sp. FL1042]|nr:hypothetical protein F5Y09DRAFT_203362 [Xylaria sp. FL1042]
MAQAAIFYGTIALIGLILLAFRMSLRQALNVVLSRCIHVGVHSPNTTYHGPRLMKYQAHTSLRESGSVCRGLFSSADLCL